MEELLIFPTHDKKPLTPNGFKDARPEHCWTGEESEQWGAPTGEANGFIVVDVDAKQGGLESASSIDFGPTLKVNTPGGGFHVFYQYDKSMMEGLRNKVGILPGIDIRTNGGYVVLYKEVDKRSIRPIPPTVMALIEHNSRQNASSPSVKGEVAEGGRNAYLTKHAGRMQKIGVLTLAALQEINERDCSPPLEESEVSLIFQSVSRYAPDSTPEEDEEPQKKIIWANEMVGTMFEFLRDKGKSLGESTGIEELDTLLGGGKRLGELTVTMAEAKTGKNTFWHFQQKTLLDRGIAMGYASRELSPETEVLPNLITLKTGKNIYKHDISEDEVMKALSGWKLAFAPGYGSFQGNELFEWMDECLLHGVRYFWIDHLHYCLVDAEDFKLVSEFGRKLKTYCKTNMVHIDLIIQPKNVPFIKVGDKMVPQELDIGLLRGGANLGQVLDSLITMQRVRTEEGDLSNVTKIELKRARSKLARPGKIFMEYQFEDMSFKVVAEDSESSESPKIKVIDKKQEAKYNESKSTGTFFDLKRKAQVMMKGRQDESINE